MIRNKISEIGLMLWILTIGVIIGGTFFQMQAIVPEWSGELPASLVRFFQGTNWAAAQSRFWQFPAFYPGYACGFLALAAGWHERRRRVWLIASLSFGIGAFLSTIFYFMPQVVGPLFFGGGAGLSADEITSRAEDWIFWNRIRFGALIVCFFAALKALANRSERAF